MHFVALHGDYKNEFSVAKLHHCRYDKLTQQYFNSEPEKWLSTSEQQLSWQYYFPLLSTKLVSTMSC